MGRRPLLPARSPGSVRGRPCASCKTPASPIPVFARVPNSTPRAHRTPATARPSTAAPAEVFLLKKSPAAVPCVRLATPAACPPSTTSPATRSNSWTARTEPNAKHLATECGDFFGAPQRRRFCLSAGRGGRRRCHGRHRDRTRMRPAWFHAAPASICNICWDCPHRATRTFRCSCRRTAAAFPSAIAIRTWANSALALARPEALLGWLAGQTGIAPDTTPRTAEQLVEHFSWDVIRAHRGEHHCNGRVASHPASTQHPRAGVRRPSERCSRRARCDARPGWYPDENARSTSACSPSNLPAHRKMP